MLKQFLNHIERNKIFNRFDKILLAVSGGVDSMVMLDLFKQAGFSIGVAHCNFQLRGTESNDDETLVRHTCTVLGINFYTTSFETENYAAQNKISIQMAARDLRYQYFQEICAQYGYTYIATAHHLNDSLETVLLNMVRSTGIDGITGISVKHQNIVRPMLFATRDMIEEYASSFKLTWREDASNSTDKYHRNLLRNQVIPLLKKINPNLEKSFQSSLERFQGTALLAEATLHRFKNASIRESEQQVCINIHDLTTQLVPAVMLWELIKDKGFNYVQCKEITDTHHQTGKIFYSETHQLTIDRAHLIISVKDKTYPSDILIERNGLTWQRGNQTLICEVIERKNFSLQSDSSLAQLDLDILTFPLTWRRWKVGDKFMPLGMKQMKKISDYLIDVKLPLPEKDNITVLESANEIVWVTGYRVSDKFKVTESTKNIFKVYRKM